jgi:SNF2 family DNA or RNA helicase
VLDEIHYCGNPKSKRAMAVAAWRALHPQAYAVGLSGTPIPAYVWQLWHCLDILWPGRFGRAWNFQERYCDGRWEEIAHTEKTVWNREGVSRSEELAKRLSACMLRRTKADVALELPPRTRTTIEIELPPKALRDLHKAAAAIDWSGGQLQGKGVSALLSHIEEYKIDAAEELAMNVMAAGSRPLILTTRKATAAELGRRLSAPVADGDVDPQERQRLLADAECGVATLYAVTTGIDLVGYDVIIMTGLDWVPSTLLQGEARIHRIGQHRPVTIYYLIGQHTLDEVVRERVIERLDTFGSIIGDDGSDGMGRALGALGDDELLAGLVASMKEAA